MKKKLYILIVFSMLLSAACASSDTDHGAPTGESAADAGDSEITDIIIPELSEPAPVEITEEVFDSGTPYGDHEHYIEVLGLKEYDLLETDTYTDTPSEGSTYLILFLKIENRTAETDYVNPYYLTASIDGGMVENVPLLNDPEGYSTIFTHIPAGSSLSGFVAWEVPKSWEEFSLDFNNWKDKDGLVLHAAFTRADLKDPEIAQSNKWDKS